VFSPPGAFKFLRIQLVRKAILRDYMTRFCLRDKAFGLLRDGSSKVLAWYASLFGR